MTSRNVPSTLTIKEALQNIEKWSLHAPTTNKYTRQPEAKILYDGAMSCIQVGTPQQPIYCPFGLSRWNARVHKFDTIDNSDDTSWLYQAQESSGFSNRRLPNSKVQSLLTAHDWETEGTQGYFFYNFMVAIKERVIDGLVNGVPDLNQLGPDGKPVTVPACDIGATGSPEERKMLIQRLLQDPIQTSRDNQYAPNIKTKVRACVRKDGLGEFVTTDLDIIDASTMQPVAQREHLNFFKKGCRGVFVFKLNAITYKKSEMNMTIDVLKAMIMPSTSLLKQVEFRLEDFDVQQTEEEGGQDDVMQQ